ncbi:MAG: hypothetical protein JW760_07035, partial [Spirochaetales bacterium]|nr:hypothetical protein [Spirochaetales bacterium]
PPCSETVIIPGCQIPEWRKALAGVTASHQRVEACFYPAGKNPGIRLRGRDTDVRRAEELYRHLDSQVAEISPKYVSVVRDIEGFRLGMVAGIEEKLEQQRMPSRSEERNLVVREEGGEGEQPLFIGSADPDSYGLGKAVGRKIPLP